MVLRKGKKPVSQELDLHGVRHKDVPRKLWMFVEDHVRWGYECSLVIVTGNSERMQEIVKKELFDYGLRAWRGLARRGRLRVEMEGWRD